MFWKRASLPGWQEHRQTCINLKPPFHPTLGGSVWLQVQRYAKVTSQVISMFKFFIGFLPNFPSVDLAPHIPLWGGGEPEAKSSHEIRNSLWIQIYQMSVQVWRGQGIYIQIDRQIIMQLLGTREVSQSQIYTPSMTRKNLQWPPSSI